jgi:RNA polymerase sigma factor (sigma-70 family)
LVQDVTTAEDVVQDSFVAMHTAWRHLRGGDQALAYLHQSVVSRSRSVRRHRAVIEQSACRMPGAEPGAPFAPRNAALVRALRLLPAQQREALVLRCYGDLPEAQVASAMGVSDAAVKRHLAGAAAALRVVVGVGP